MKQFFSHKMLGDYGRLVLSVFGIMLLLNAAFALNMYKSHQESLQLRLEQRAVRLDVTATDAFDYIAYLMNFLGHQIARNGADYHYISSLYSGFSDDLKVRNLSSWSMFDWLSPDKKIRVTSVNGILKEGVDLSDRKNLVKADKYSDTVFFNQPTLGKISHQWIIPISRSVNDLQGNRLGFINIGIMVSSIMSRLKETSSNDNLAFLILTDEFQLVAPEDASRTPGIGPNNEKPDISISSHLKKQITGQKGILEPPFDRNGVRYHYYLKSPKYPFIFLVGYNNAEQQWIFLQALIVPVIGFIVLGGCAILLSYRLYKRVINPVKILGDAAGRLMHEDTVISLDDERLPVEIRNLASQLRTIDVYKRQLIYAKEAVEKASEIKSQFLANMSHELRTPLTAINGYSELIVRQFYGPLDEKYEKAGEAILSSGKHLLHLINQLLDLSKIEAGKMDLDEYPHDIKELFESCRGYIAHMAEKKGVEFTVQCEEDFPLLYCDGFRIKQVLLNLLSNALKFTPKGGRFTLSAYMEEGKMVLATEDTGIGIAAEDIPAMLSEFKQAKQDGSYEYHGTGLGLPIAKQLTEAHQATLSITSQLGEGTVVALIFPPERVYPRTRSRMSA